MSKTSSHPSSQVNEKSIDTALTYINNASEGQLDEIVESFAIEQPVLLGYLMNAGVEYENEELHAHVMYYFSVIMKAVREQGLQMRLLTEDDIDNFQEPFIAALDDLNETEDILPLFELTAQPTLIGFLTTDLEMEDEDGNMLDEDTAEQLFIVISSMIGLVNIALSKN